MSEARRIDYALAEEKEKFRLAAENPNKMAGVAELIERHRDGAGMNGDSEKKQPDSDCFYHKFELHYLISHHDVLLLYPLYREP